MTATQIKIFGGSTYDFGWHYLRLTSTIFVIPPFIGGSYLRNVRFIGGIAPYDSLWLQIIVGNFHPYMGGKSASTNL